MKQERPSATAHLDPNYEELLERAARLEQQHAALLRLHELSIRLASEAAFPALLQAVIDAAVTISDARMGTLQLYDEAAQCLRTVAQRGCEPIFVENVAAVHDDPAICGNLQRREQVIIEDVAKRPSVVGRPAMAVMKAAGARAVQSTTMRARDGRLLGRIATYWREPHRPSEVTLQMLELLGREAAGLIERKRAENASRMEPQRLYDVLETLPAMICLLTPDHHVPFANRSFRERFGESRGRRCYEYCFGLAAPCSFCRAFHVLETGKPIRWELTAPDGTSVFEVHHFPFADNDGSPLVLEMDIDITDRKRSHTALRALNETLEQRVAERTAALREADRRKDEFLAVLSHELRGPLAPIRNSVFILEHATPGSEQARRAREVIERQSAHLARLVDDLLDFNRISLGKIELKRELMDTVDLVCRTVEDHRASFTQKDIVLLVDAPQQPLWIDADPTRIAQVVGNLLGNACKFTPRDGSVHVRVSVAAEESQAVLAVRDTGAGIAEGLLGRVFEPFTQGEQPLSRPHGGLGLGLALVKGFIEMHGGMVSASSAGPGQGAEFVVRLPLAEEAVCAEPRPVVTKATRGLRVLVIEDNHDAAESLQLVLTLLGHEAQVAFDGKTGTAIAREMRPDVVLCDIGLPDTDGYAVASELRAEPLLASCTLVALTGYAQPEDLAKAKQAGFDYHLAKPPGLDRLQELLAHDDEPLTPANA